MTTQRLPLEEIFSCQPASSDDGSPPPRRRRGWGEAAERAGQRWTVVVWVLVLAALIAAMILAVDRWNAAHGRRGGRAGKLQPRTGLDAVSRLLAACWAPVVVKRHTARLTRRLTRPVCTDTSLVSNLGALLDSGAAGDFTTGYCRALAELAALPQGRPA